MAPKSKIIRAMTQSAKLEESKQIKQKNIKVLIEWYTTANIEVQTVKYG